MRSIWELSVLFIQVLLEMLLKTQQCGAGINTDIWNNGIEQRAQIQTRMCDGMIYDKGAKYIYWGNDKCFWIN